MSFTGTFCFIGVDAGNGTFWFVIGMDWMGCAEGCGCFCRGAGSSFVDSGRVIVVVVVIGGSFLDLVGDDIVV